MNRAKQKHLDDSIYRHSIDVSCAWQGFSCRCAACAGSRRTGCRMLPHAAALVVIEFALVIETTRSAVSACVCMFQAFISTVNLDGETNLKAPGNAPVMAAMGCVSGNARQVSCSTFDVVPGTACRRLAVCHHRHARGTRMSQRRLDMTRQRAVRCEMSVPPIFCQGRAGRAPHQPQTCGRRLRMVAEVLSEQY